MESQSLRHGLAALEALVQADTPLSATRVAQEIDTHQTTASRILRDLCEAGYVRRVGYQKFAVDYGMLVLGVQSAQHFPLLVKPRLAIEAASRMCRGLSASLVLLWRARLLYFNEASRDLETRLFKGYGFPLHLSSAGLLFLLSKPSTKAVAMLHGSRERNGWDRPTENVPATEGAVLAHARNLAQGDMIVLRNWQHTGHVSAAALLPSFQGAPVALTLAGPGDVLSDEGIRHRLMQIRDLVALSIPYEDAPRKPAPPEVGGALSNGWA